MIPATLEFELPADADAALFKHPGLSGLSRVTPIKLVWHDTPGAALAAQGLTALAEDGRWRLESLWPGDAPWPPGTPPPLLAEAGTPGGLGFPDAAAPLQPAAAFHGQLRAGTLGGAEAAVDLTVLHGMLRGVAGDRPACRLRLHGDTRRLGPAASSLAAALPLRVPRASLAADGLATAQDRPAPARRLGAPTPPRGLDVSDTASWAIGHLADVLLHWAGSAGAGTTPEPVHQMRVALRRLRSVLALFRPALACQETESLLPPLKRVATLLGAARDWDVFLDGTGRGVASGLGEDRRIASMLASAGRRRQAAYVALRAALAGPDFRGLEVALACAAALRPWQFDPSPDQANLLAQSTASFASSALRRRWKHVRAAGKQSAELPAADLHEWRKDCKKLRYAAELFTPTFPGTRGKRFIKRLRALQDTLGTLNDGAVAAGLMAGLGRADRSFAAGAVRGFVAGRSENAQTDMRAAWKRFRRCEPFWD